MTLWLVAFLILSGFGAGLIGALFGLGGGILIVPILVLVLEVPMHNAVATSLLCVIATSSAAASKNVSKGIANIHLGMALEVWTVAGSILGSFVAGLLPGRTLMILFASAMSLMAIPMARGVEDVEREQSPEGDEAPGQSSGFLRKLRGEYFDPAEGSVVYYQTQRVPVAMGVSSLAGVLSGLLGVGGGILKVPVLATWCDVPMKAAAATSNFMIGVTAVASAFVYYGREQISPLITAASVIGVFAGSRTGSVLAAKIHGRRLRQAFAVLMVVVAAQMFWRSFR
jgi:uncharacterized membrane protein YfcA